MEMTDYRLSLQQRQNDLKAFLDYEQRLRDAYARSQDPHPGKRWLCSDPGGRVRRDSEFDALG